MKKFLNLLLLLLVSVTWAQSITLPQGYIAKLADGTVLSQYKYLPETQQIFNRAIEEGYTLPNENIKVAMNRLIKDMKADGYWQKRDVFFNFNYNNSGLENFSLINWKNPRSITNLVTYSSDFSNAVWIYSGNSKTPNTLDTAAPDGTMTACKLANTGTVSVATHMNIIANSTIITYSIYVKGGTAITGLYRLRDDTAGTTKASSQITYSDGTTVGGGTTQNVGNGWWRLTITATNCVIGNSHRIYVGDISSATTGDTWYVWGPQVEDRAVASKYTPTGATEIYGNGIASRHGSMAYGINGFTGNGTNGYINTKYNPYVKGVTFTANLAGMDAVLFGAGSGHVFSNGGTSNRTLVGNYNSAFFRINFTGDATTMINMTGSGYITWERLDSTTGKGRVLSTSIPVTMGGTGTIAITTSYFLLSRASTESYSAISISTAGIGSTITDSQYSNFKVYYQNFCNKIGSTIIP